MVARGCNVFNYAEMVKNVSIKLDLLLFDQMRYLCFAL